MSAAQNAAGSPRIAKWNLSDLVEWDRRIRDKSAEFGLD